MVVLLVRGGRWCFKIVKAGSLSEIQVELREFSLKRGVIVKLFGYAKIRDFWNNGWIEVDLPERVFNALMTLFRLDFRRYWRIFKGVSDGDEIVRRIEMCRLAEGLGS
jgi:hypothetical protein